MPKRLQWAREYRKRARECLQMARHLSLDYQREALALEAAQYTAMADQLEAEFRREFDPKPPGEAEARG